MLILHMLMCCSWTRFSSTYHCCEVHKLLQAKVSLDSCDYGFSTLFHKGCVCDTAFMNGRFLVLISAFIFVNGWKDILSN